MEMQNHHILKLQFWWPDSRDNIVRLSAFDHIDVLHGTLDLPSRKSSQYIRKLRMMTNHKLVMPPEGIALMGEMQKEFFKDIRKLPQWMQLFHIEKIGLLAEQERNRYYKMFNHHFDWPKIKTNDGDKVHAVLDNYIDCKQEIAKEIIAFLRTEFSVW